MDDLSKDGLMTSAAILLLFMTALMQWTILSWLILVAIILIFLAWNVRE